MPDTRRPSAFRYACATFSVMAGILAGFASQTVPAPQQRYRSSVTVYDLARRTASVVYQADQVIEAPNWSRDGRMLAFSASIPSSRQSQVYVARADGSGVRLLTPLAPSYFHGWSPDGKWLAFVGRRDDKYELYRVAAGGGPGAAEQRLTSSGGYDDGPEYSPDGRWIYFNSNRGGGWNIWRMPPEGAGASDARAERVTGDALEDWFPHISPDGKWMVFLSFPAGTSGHNEKMEGVTLRMMRTPGARLPAAPKIEVLTSIFGGQGTINVNSWSPDSKRFAYVVYAPLSR